MTNNQKGFSGKNVSEVTVEAIRRGDITLDDVRIHPETLAHQADVAKANGNPQLAANFLRAAELTSLSDEMILGYYDALRPGRSTVQDLLDIATALESVGATRNAELFRQAADVYARRGLTAK
jgi:propanediol dehydratase small subunit